MIACLGGFCSSRDTCSDYQRGYGAGLREEKVCQLLERLCGQVEEPTPIVRVVKKEEREDE